MTTAEQKIRKTLSHKQDRFQHEGSSIVRWITGGTAPDAYVTFHNGGPKTIARCPKCNQEIGDFDSNYGPNIQGQIAEIRAKAHQHENERHQ